MSERTFGNRLEPTVRPLSRREFIRRSVIAGLGLTGLGVLATSLSACASSQSSDRAPTPGQTTAAPAAPTAAPSGRDTLVVGLNSDVPPLDPHKTLGWTTMLVTLTMGEHLVGLDLTTDRRGAPPLVPVLAERYEVSPDGLQYTYHLRKGVKFHDGNLFNAKAVEFNIRRQWDKNFEHYYQPAATTSFWDYQFLKTIATPDDYTVNLTLTHPWGEFLRMNAQSWGQQFMISPAQVQKMGNDAVGNAPMLTGPFKFVERVPGERIVVERNPDYWGPVPKVTRIVFRPIPDVAARVAAIKAGEIDIAQYPIPWDNKAELEAAGVRISTCDGPYLAFLSLNHKHPIIGKKEVRQAINMAIDREGLAKGLYGDWAKPANSMLPAGSPSYDPEFPGYKYDPQGAKALLAQAGYPNGFSTQIMISEVAEREAVWIQRNLREVGIDLKINKLDFTSFGGKWAAGLNEPDGMTLASWGMSADYWIDLVARSTRQPPAGVNNGWYANQEVDRLLDQGSLENDFEKRRALYRQVGKLLHDDASHAPLFYFRQPVALAPSVQGFVRPDEDWFQLWTVYLA